MINQNKKVLVITFSFPPKHSMASVRMAGLAKYLPQHGWDPTFLTVDLPGEPEDGYRVIQVPHPGDISERVKGLLGLNPKEGMQIQLGLSDPVITSKRSLRGRILTGIKGWITYPDKRKSWKPGAVKSLRDLLSRERFDALISSSPPPITHLIAKKAKREYGLPWIADLRDLWSQNYIYPYRGLRKNLDKNLEMRTLSRADFLTTVSEPLREQLASLHPDAKIRVITNGFDPEEYKKTELSDKFSIIYTGQIYPGKQQPETFFRALSNLLSSSLISEDDVEVLFFGPPYRYMDRMISEYNLQKVVCKKGIIPREEALYNQRRAQILLVFNWVDAKQQGVYTGKVFEYLAARRPILAVGGPQGVVSDLLMETKTGIHPENEELLSDTILSWYEEFKHKGSVSYQGNEMISKYSHLKMAESIAEVLDEISCQ